MKQLVLNVQEKKYKFLIELLENFDFVSVQEEDKTKKQVLKHIAEGIHSALLASQGKMETRPASFHENILRLKKIWTASFKI